MSTNEQTDAPAPEEVKTVTASELLPELPSTPPAPAAEKPAEPVAADPRTEERDSLGRAFDPTKFRYERDSLGRWKNLRGGRRRKTDAAAETAAPVADIPEIGPEEPAGTPQAEKTDEAASEPRAEGAKTDATLSPAAGGTLLARVLYTVTGWFTGDRKAAVAKGDEHKAIASTFEAFLSFRGIALVGGLALCATVLCYFLDESRSESIAEAIKRRFAAGKKKPGDEAKPAEPAGAPVTVSTPAGQAPAGSDVIVFPE